MRLSAALGTFAAPPWPLLFALAATGFAASALASGSGDLAAFCAAGAALPMDGWLDAARAVLAVSAPGQLIGDWALMLLAMMPPLLAVPLHHVWRSSLRRRRALAIATFVAAYASVWFAAGPPLIGLAVLARVAAGSQALAFAVLAAVVWSASPWQRLALNRAHRLPRIGLFGWPAAREIVGFGAVHALWCVGSCWAWMLVPLTAGRWHVLAMLFAGLVLLTERLARPDRPRWRAPAPVAAALGLR